MIVVRLIMKKKLINRFVKWNLYLLIYFWKILFLSESTIFNNIIRNNLNLIQTISLRNLSSFIIFCAKQASCSRWKETIFKHNFLRSLQYDRA